MPTIKPIKPNRTLHQGMSIEPIEAIEVGDWSNQSKSIEVIVEAIEVNQSFKKM